MVHYALAGEIVEAVDLTAARQTTESKAGNTTISDRQRRDLQPTLAVCSERRPNRVVIPNVLEVEAFR